MLRAVALAGNSLYLSDPNPRVGCVIVRDGNILAEGWTQQAGEAHAEVHALSRLDGDARGADVYVTLEPCAHTGRTGPCCEALVRAGVRRVFAAGEDPNPLVAGSGLRALREAGIEVHVGLCAGPAASLNPGFLRRMRGGLPWVRLKLGATLDGRTADAGGHSRWITGDAAREDVHRLRGRSSAVLTGIGTVLADDPSLNARHPEATRQPLRVVLDSAGRTPATAKCLHLDGDALVVTLGGGVAGAAHWQGSAGDGGIALAPVLRMLGERQCNEVLVEAGPRLCGAFARAGLVDEYIVYLAPSLLGAEARGMFALGALPLPDRIRLEFTDVRRFGEDIRIIAVPRSH